MFSLRTSDQPLTMKLPPPCLTAGTGKGVLVVRFGLGHLTETSFWTLDVSTGTSAPQSVFMSSVHNKLKEKKKERKVISNVLLWADERVESTLLSLFLKTKDVRRLYQRSICWQHRAAGPAEEEQEEEEEEETEEKAPPLQAGERHC